MSESYSNVRVPLKKKRRGSDEGAPVDSTKRRVAEDVEEEFSPEEPVEFEFDFKKFNTEAPEAVVKLPPISPIDLGLARKCMLKIAETLDVLFVNARPLPFKTFFNFLSYVLLHEGDRVKFKDSDDDLQNFDFTPFEQETPDVDLELPYMWFNGLVGKVLSRFRNSTGAQNEIFQELLTKHSHTIPLPGKFKERTSGGVHVWSYDLIFVYWFVQRAATNKTTRQNFTSYQSIPLSEKNLEPFKAIDPDYKIFFSPTVSKEVVLYSSDELQHVPKLKRGLALAVAGQVFCGRDHDMNIKVYNTMLMELATV